MTDEEKAEEYSKGKAHEHYQFLFEENSGSPVDFAKLCYLDGLAEGKKDVCNSILQELETRHNCYSTDLLREVMNKFGVDV